MKWTREELIEKYLEFFESRGHKRVPSASLIPENDPTVLFTTAGMHPLVPFLTGQKHPLGQRITNVQKCIRTQDIEEVGDEVHHTFFEMLGNWSFGDYFKEEAIKFSFEFLTDVLKIPLSKLAVSCFAGDEDAPRDEESARVWKSLGISEKRIAFLPKENNWWGPAGETGPCGPDTEMFYWTGGGTAPESFNPNDKNWVEIWNDVFMQYNKTADGKFVPLAQKNVDTGMGVERTLAVLNGESDNYLVGGLKKIVDAIIEVSGRNYNANKKEIRIIADHVRAAVFILGDERGVKPSNVGRGYVLRRLIRRAVRYGKLLGMNKSFCSDIAKVVVESYSGFYPELKQNEKFIFDELSMEEKRFEKTLEKGMKVLGEEIKNLSENMFSGKTAFLLYQSYGFPIEMTREILAEKGVIVNDSEFEEEMKKHQELSRTASAGTFKSGLADDSERTTRLHTATHLLNEALRRILGEEVRQKGSNITPERLRFDFNFPRKLSEMEIKRVENLVNEKISSGLEVVREEMSLDEAMKSGAQAEFGMKYPDLVSVYTILDNSEKRGWFSREICTGPHVSNTSEVGKFKILKEESSSAGVRRIKATVE